MLILGRRPGESIVIMVDGKKELEIFVTDICRGQAKVGIRADEKYNIVRSELLEQSTTHRSR